MIRINLLPPEIVQKRKDEARWKWVVLGGVIAFALVGAFWMFMALSVQAKQTEVDAAKQEAAGLEAQAGQFAVFQEREADLSTRTSIRDAAASDRVDWARLLEEISLILPNDMYLTALSGKEPAAGVVGDLTYSGNALPASDSNPRSGAKTVAKLLVRLTELNQISNVWLGSLTIPLAGTASDGGASSAGYVNFAGTAKIEGQNTSSTAAVPPPPAP